MWPRLSHADLELYEPFRPPADNKENSVQAVFFDIGSVLIDLDWDTFFKRQRELNPDDPHFSTDAMMARVRENQLMVKWCTGKSGPFEYVKGMLEAAGHSAERAHSLALGTEPLSGGMFAPALVKELSSIIVGPVRPRIVRLIKNLRNRGYIVGALSNATPWHESDILKTVPLHELFDTVIFSQDVGSEKPDERIYTAAHVSAQNIYMTRQPESTSARRQLRPSNLAFVDDTPVNVRAARALGWHSSMVCLLKDQYLQRADQSSEQELSHVSVCSENLVFADEAARRVEGLFSHLLSVTGIVRP